jgi:hypothetical protein
VAALSGMRIEEIYRSTDCGGLSDKSFRARHAKTRVRVRRVPVHSALAAIVTRRCEGKPVNAFLFHEPGPVRDGRERSMVLSKRFGRHRQALGVHETVDGARHSRWTSTPGAAGSSPPPVTPALTGLWWRLWWATRSVISRIILYSGGLDEKLLRACVEAVRLPALRRPADLAGAARRYTCLIRGSAAG